MRHLFSAQGEQAIDGLLGRRPLLGFGYDGTLAPITPLPMNARTTGQVARPLALLNSWTPVAVLSGRCVSDVQMRLPFRPTYLIGNHGIEGLPGLEPLSAQARQLCRDWLRQLGGMDDLPSRCPGVLIEDKDVSLSLHYRLCRERASARQAIDERIATLVPRPRVIGGHCVVNLLHPHAPDKNVALEHLILLSNCDTAVYVGDDDSDEVVFRAAHPHWVTVRVGYVPDTAARFFVHNQGEVGALLMKLVSKLRLTESGRM